MSRESRIISIIMLLAICIFLVEPAAASGFRLWGTGKLDTAPSGEFGDNFVGPGLGFSGEGYFALNSTGAAPTGPTFLLGGGLHFELYGAKEVSGTDHNFTDGTLGLGLEIGGIILIPAGSQISPFVGLSFGRGALAWAYSDEASMYMGSDSDGIGFFYTAIRGGLILNFSEQMGLIGGARYVMPRFDDETAEGYIWDVDGGNMLQLFVGLEISM